jgi:DNA-binding NarL/FixJ family response regulator
MDSEQQHQDAQQRREISLAILQRNELDCEALVALLQAEPTYRIVGASSSLKSLLSTCSQFQPDVALVDAKFPARYGDVVEHSETLIRERKVRGIMFLDELPNNLRAVQATSLGWAGYITRRCTSGQLMLALADLLAGQTPVDNTRNAGPQTGVQPQGGPHITGSPFAALTPKEFEVFRLLAQGQSAKACAEALNLSVSTIENHRSRILKKLNVSKSVHLALLAVREGLISP